MQKIDSANITSLILKGASVTLGLKLIYLLLTFILSVVLARSLGAEGLGAYTYVMSWVWLLSVFAKMGIPELSVREIAAAQSGKHWSLFKGFERFANCSIILLSITISGCGIAVAFFFYQSQGDLVLYHSFVIGFLVLPFISLTSLRQNSLRALHVVAWGQLPEYIVKPALLISAVILLSFLKNGEINVVSVLLLNLSASLIALCLGIYILRKKMPHQVRHAAPEIQWKAWLVSSLSFLFIGGMQMINSRADKVMLGMLADLKDVGVYFVAQQFASVIGLTLIASNFVIAPVVVKLYAEKDLYRIQRVILTWGSVALAGTLILSLAIWVMFPLLIKFFGSDFLGGRTVLLILMAGQVINVASGSAGTLLSMTNNEKIVGLAVAVSALCNITLNAVLIPRFGMNGAAVATAFSVLTWNGIMIFYTYKNLGIHSTPLGWLWKSNHG